MCGQRRQPPRGVWAHAAQGRHRRGAAGFPAVRDVQVDRRLRQGGERNPGGAHVLVLWPEKGRDVEGPVRHAGGAQGAHAGGAGDADLHLRRLAGHDRLRRRHRQPGPGVEGPRRRHRPSRRPGRRRQLRHCPALGARPVCLQQAGGRRPGEGLRPDQERLCEAQGDAAQRARVEDGLPAGRELGRQQAEARRDDAALDALRASGPQGGRRRRHRPLLHRLLQDPEAARRPHARHVRAGRRPARPADRLLEPRLRLLLLRPEPRRPQQPLRPGRPQARRRACRELTIRTPNVST
mmetsp:Transcript_54276/g.142936  ORF Transcript_54276/g.142936 Transcript_54276/m.142936 type:complete len:294 (-) Transcript_54276:63-944(-)